MTTADRRRELLAATVKALSMNRRVGGPTVTAAVMGVTRSAITRMMLGELPLHDSRVADLADGLRDLALRLERLADAFDAEMLDRPHVRIVSQPRRPDGAFSRQEFRQ